MDALNKLLTGIGDGFFGPLSQWPLATLLLISVVTGIGMTVVFKFASNQQALANVLNRSRGHALGIKLFKDDISGMFSSLFSVFGLMLLRIWYSIAPVLVMIIPLFFLLAQCFLRYEYRPLAAKEPVIVQLSFNADQWDKLGDVQVESNDRLNFETDAMRDEELRSMYWRISVNEPGLMEVVWKIGDKSFTKDLVADSDQNILQPVNQRRSNQSLWDRLWFVGEPNIGEAPVSAAIVHYPKRVLQIFGYTVPWWVTFFAVSILVALLAQPFLKVRF